MHNQLFGQNLDAAFFEGRAQFLQAGAVLLGAGAEDRSRRHALWIERLSELDGDLVGLSAVILGADEADGQAFGHISGLELLGGA